MRHSVRHILMSGAALTSLSEQVAALFVDGPGYHDGFLRDPSDLTSMRVGRNGSGGAPAADSVVGLVLDKRMMGGQTAEAYIEALTEDIANGDFSSGDLTSWTDASTGTGSASYSSGACSLVGTDGSNVGSISQAHDASSGDWVRVLVTTVMTSGTITASVGGQSASVTTSGAHEFIWRLSSTADLTFATASGGGNGTVDGISLKSVPGNHAVAPSDAGRAILRASPWRIEQDGTDDYYRAYVASLTSDMEFFGGVKSTDTEAAWVAIEGAGIPWCGVWTDGSSSTQLSNASGTPSFYIDGNAFSGSTRDDMHTLVADGAWHTANIRSFNMTANAGWVNNVCFWAYPSTSSSNLGGDSGPIVLIETGALDAAGRSLIKDWIEEEVGL